MGILIFISGICSAQLFPTQCLGQWQGEMDIYANGVKVDSIEVKFTVESLSDSLWTWRMEYLRPGSPLVKDYKLKLINAASGTFVTDEGDGIALMNVQIKNRLLCMFQVGESSFMASYEVNGDQLIFEVLSSNNGSEIPNTEIIPQHIIAVQHAVLSKVN
jgi:hypothetical protein